MLGAIIGDIVGSRFEFNNHRSKVFELFTEDCRVTDDSIMTLAVAKAIMAAGKSGCLLLENEAGNREYYRRVERLAASTMQELGHNYPHCGYGGRFRQWLFSAAPKPYNCYGNGAAMRISPAAFAARSETEARMLSEVITRVTHNHPEGLKGAEATVLAIYMARQGADKQAIRERINGYFYPLDFTIAAIRDSYSFSPTCQETVPQAIEAFLESSSFEDAIRTVISLGGDSDTLAAITGGIAEAYYGIPEAIGSKALSYLDDDLQKIYADWQEYLKNGPRTLVFRQAALPEREFLFRAGYREWARGRTYEQYVRDNQKEDDYGTRYVLTCADEIVSSAIVLKLAPIFGKKVRGIGSILTPEIHSHQGYATILLKKCLQQIDSEEDGLVFLHSDIDPAFYRRLGFRVLPENLQRSATSACMVRCAEDVWKKLLNGASKLIPDYF